MLTVIHIPEAIEFLNTKLLRTADCLPSASLCIIISPSEACADPLSIFEHTSAGGLVISFV